MVKVRCRLRRENRRARSASRVVPLLGRRLPGRWEANKLPCTTSSATFGLWVLSLLISFVLPWLKIQAFPFDCSIGTMPSADFCPYRIYFVRSRISIDYRFLDRSPGVRHHTCIRCGWIYLASLRLTFGGIRFIARFPDLPCLLSSSCSSTPGLCLGLPSDFRSPGTPLALAMGFPSVGPLRTCWRFRLLTY